MNTADYTVLLKSQKDNIRVLYGADISQQYFHCSDLGMNFVLAAFLNTAEA